MNRRDALRDSYELAFYPPRLNRAWHAVKRGDTLDAEELGACLDTALLLHQALPVDGYASQRALNRLALYQAKSRAFGMVQFIENVRRRLGRGPLKQTRMPGELVRDIGLPPLSHSGAKKTSKTNPSPSSR